MLTTKEKCRTGDKGLEVNELVGHCVHSAKQREAYRERERNKSRERCRTGDKGFEFAKVVGHRIGNDEQTETCAQRERQVPHR